MRQRIFFRAFVLFIILASISILSARDHERLLLGVRHADYPAVEKAIIDAGGQVLLKHRYCEGMAVSLPSDRINEITVRGDVFSVSKDFMIEKPQPVRLNHPGLLHLPLYGETQASHNRSLSADELKGLLSDELEGYYPYTINLTGANTFMKTTGHMGEDVIVAVIDDGVSATAFAVGPRVIGGENYTGDGIPATSANNQPHGTWVACCIGANAIFGFGNPAIQNAVKTHLPNSVIPDFFVPGIDGIPMVGQAPGALFYALKVFPASGGGAPRSVIAAAYERAIELKENYNQGLADALNIRIVNMSLGGISLFAGNDPFYTPLAERAREVGILTVVSAGNDGPAGMSIGSPGDCKNLLTVGASDDAVYERILVDIFDPGFGTLFRPVLNHQTALFSSRGPTADGRVDPELVAPGTWRYVQHANGTTINWVGGTSFSAPTVSGAAALLVSAYPNATPDQLRGALIRGANPDVLTDRSQKMDQGRGFLDVMGAKTQLEEGKLRVRDIGAEHYRVSKNIDLLRIKYVSETDHYSANTGQLLPGECEQIYFSVHPFSKRMKVTISDVIPKLPPAEQNQLFGDDLYVTIHSSKTSAFSDYRAGTPAFVGPAGAEFILEESSLEEGFIRVTVCGDWTNAGNISAKVTIEVEVDDEYGTTFSKSDILEGELHSYSLNIKENVTAMHLRLAWTMNWAYYPTNDLDMLVFDPSGNLVLLDNDLDLDFDGISFDSPERITIFDPVPGVWTILVDGFTIWEGKDRYKLCVDMDRLIPVAKTESGMNSPVAMVPDHYFIAQNYPNPFNPMTTIEYQLPEQSQIQLNIYNIQGQLVRSLINDFKAAGYYSAVWDGKDNSGRYAPSGTYIYRLDTSEYTKSYKMVLTR